MQCFNIDVAELCNLILLQTNFRMSDNIREFVAKKCEESTGRFSPSTEKYVNKLNGFEKPSQIGKCNACERECDTICSRCSTHYCSVECQRNDWQEHRYVCGKPKYVNKFLQDFVFIVHTFTLTKIESSFKQAQNY